jgi:hypothetical protein
MVYEGVPQEDFNGFLLVYRSKRQPIIYTYLKHSGDVPLDVEKREEGVAD